MSWQIGLLLSLLAVAIGMFWWERLPAEVTALGLLLATVFTGLLPAKNAFDGFGSDAVMMILGLLILTASLQRTGVVEMVGRAVLTRVGDNPRWLFLTVICAAALLSAFISNTASTAFFLPIVFGIAQAAKMPASQLLLPLAFSSILTSSVTLVSTSTNMVVSGVMTDYGLPPMRMFELAPVGIPISIVGLTYLWICRRWIPVRGNQELTEDFGVRPYLTELVITPESPLVDKTLDEAKLGQTMGLTVLGLNRDFHKHLGACRDTKLQAGDLLVVEAGQDDIVKIKDIKGIEIKSDAALTDPDLQNESIGLAEAIILPASPLIGRTLKQIHFRERYGLQVLGLNHQGRNVGPKLSTIPLRLGDMLLLQGPRERIAELHNVEAFRLLGPIAAMEEARPKRRHAPLAIGIFALVLGLTTFGVTTLPVAAMLGVFLVFATGCISPQEAYAAVEWKAIILIGAMLGMGTAMKETGAAEYLAGLIVNSAGNLGPRGLLTGFFLLTCLLTQPMSNQAAAIVVIPIAMHTAIQAGFNPRSFAMMIAVAASCSYLTPLEPSCLMVYGPGRYRFTDFLKFGSVLTLLIYLLAITLVPVIWPLR
jgi:di/tricarboxylate transporter